MWAIIENILEITKFWKVAIFGKVRKVTESGRDTQQLLSRDLFIYLFIYENIKTKYVVINHFNLFFQNLLGQETHFLCFLPYGSRETDPQKVFLSTISGIY